MRLWSQLFGPARGPGRGVLSKDCRAALRLAREEAAAMGSRYVGTEHLLLGVCRAAPLAAPDDRLGRSGVSLHHVSEAVRVAMRMRQPDPDGGSAARVDAHDLPLTARARLVLRLAESERRDCEAGETSLAHLLVGLLREEKGIASGALRDSGLTLEVLRGRLRGGPQ